MGTTAQSALDVFKEETQELLAELEESLLEMEESSANQEAVGKAFRAMHTIKGSGAMYGFDDISDFAHEVESVFGLVRDGEIGVTEELMDLTLAARDQIREMLNEEKSGDIKKRNEEIVAGLRKLLPAGEKKEEVETAAAAPFTPPQPASQNVTYRIRFRPQRGIIAKGTDPLFLLSQLRELGECKAVAHVDEIPPLKDFDPNLCYAYWDIILTTGQGTEAIRDVFIFVEDEVELRIDVIGAEGELSDEESYKRLGEILVERGDLSPEDLEKTIKNRKHIGEMLVEAGVVEMGKVESALMEQEHFRNLREKKKGAEVVSSVRVASEKLDALVNLVGELVTVQARLSQTAAGFKDPGLSQISEEVERLTAELRDNAMSIRMLPIGAAFNKFKRLVRDLSRELGKEVELVTEGAETELDKTVMEKINDPLVHLIRNSIDHGIEPPKVREAAGKAARGTIHLSAAHSGANVLIRIRDDGAGLDPEAIRAKAVEKGLLSPDARLADKEIFNFIFAPGFSTAKDVTSISGRGVGMDVVKRNMDALRGSIAIESKEGEGTEITLRLPLTLAIIEGLLVRISGGFFVLPLSRVEECVELTRREEAASHGHRIAKVRGEIVPYIVLREFLGIGGAAPDIAQVVVTEMEGQRIGFVVDEVVGQRQTVIKSLGRAYRDVDWFSGATILGDGTVALILDISRLFQMVKRKEVES